MGLEPFALGRVARGLAGFGHTTLVLERGCPSPALLACRAGIRVTAALDDLAPSTAAERFERSARITLRRNGFERLRRLDGQGSVGALVADGEALASWRVGAGRLLGEVGATTAGGTRVARYADPCAQDGPPIAAPSSQPCVGVLLHAAPLVALLREISVTGGPLAHIRSDLIGTVRDP